MRKAQKLIERIIEMAKDFPPSTQKKGKARGKAHAWGKMTPVQFYVVPVGEYFWYDDIQYTKTSMSTGKSVGGSQKSFKGDDYVDVPT